MSQQPPEIPTPAPSIPEDTPIEADVFPLDTAVVVPLGTGTTAIGSMHHYVLGPTLAILPLKQPVPPGVTPGLDQVAYNGIYITFAQRQAVETLLSAATHLLQAWPAEEPAPIPPTPPDAAHG